MLLIINKLKFSHQCRGPPVANFIDDPVEDEAAQHDEELPLIEDEDQIPLQSWSV